MFQVSMVLNHAIKINQPYVYKYIFCLLTFFTLNYIKKLYIVYFLAVSIETNIDIDHLEDGEIANDETNINVIDRNVDQSAEPKI